MAIGKFSKTSINYQAIMRFKFLRLLLLFIFITGLSVTGSLSQDDDDSIFEEEEDETEQTESYPMPEHREELLPEEFIKIQQANSAILLDVRGKAELKYGVIKNSVNVPLYVLETEHKKLPKDKPIVISPPPSHTFATL